MALVGLDSDEGQQEEEKIFVELMTSDRELEGSRRGSK